jgi:glutamate N-acetyltransferase/amino-acid N-acetyltransferase
MKGILTMKTIPGGGITSAKGYEAAGVAAAIKYQNRKDMALIYSTTPAITAGTFTTNVVKAAPVKWDMDIVAKHETARCVIVNAGIANACTGQEGMEHCQQTAQAAATALGIRPEEVLIGSTGVIGMPLPIERIETGIKELAKIKASDPTAGTSAAEAIMTTDTIVKQTAVQVIIGDTAVTIGGMSKGSGMMHPNMCTMLAYVTTDAAITKELLTKAVNEIVPDTYNMISIDGDTSTNDTLLVLANGQAGNPTITEENEAYQIFKDALFHVNETLAKMMAADGEGATTLIETKITGAADKEAARILAKAVIGSSLVKAAIFGRDANWGRIICALGYSGTDFDPEKVTLSFESEAGLVKIYENGTACQYDEAEATKILKAPEVTILVNMNMGNAVATAWGCDLTYDYVKINADYRS